MTTEIEDNLIATPFSLATQSNLEPITWLQDLDGSLLASASEEDFLLVSATDDDHFASLDPKPEAPRTDSGSSSTISGSAYPHGTNTTWHIALCSSA